MATATAPKAPPVLATKATSTPVAATPAPVAKDFPPHTPPQATTRKTGLPVETPNTKPSQPVKDIPKSPVNGHASGHGIPQPKPGTPRSSLTHHSSGGDHMHHGQGFVRGVNEVTHVSEPYCPNPSLPNITKDYETKVRVTQRIPEMRKVEKTFFVKQLVHEDRTTTVKKSRVIMVDAEEWVQVPVIKEVPKLKRIAVHKIREEVRNQTYEVPVIEYERQSVVKQIPRVRMVDVEEEITVPVINEVPETVKVQIPTGEFCENPVEEYRTPGDFNLLCKDGRHHGDHHKHRSGGSGSSSSDSESDGEGSHSPKPMKGDVATAISTKHEQDYGSRKSLSPVKTKPVQTHTKPSGDSKPKAPEPHDRLHEDPRSKPEPHDNQHEGLTLKPEPQGERYPDIKLRPHEEPNPKPHEENQYLDTKPKTHEEPHDTKPKAPTTHSKPKVPTPNARKRTN